MYNLYKKNDSFYYQTIKKNSMDGREEVYNLWYQIYYLEMGRNLQYVNHKKQQIMDSLEPHSYIFTARMHNRIVGSFRINFPEDGNLSYYKDFYELENLNSQEISIGTRYMVDRDYRGLYISWYLIDEAMKFLSLMNKKTLIIDCSPPVYEHFEKLGFTDLVGEKQSPEYGCVRIMKYDIG
jgi:predicted GNAT family N-acyltransferase